MSDFDTICALATAPGVAGIAVVRISGSQAFNTIDQLFDSNTKISQAPSHTIHYGHLRVDRDDDSVRDEVLISVFKSPKSYTGEDVVEISCHGGSVMPSMVINAILAQGVRHATAGEFTKRAFMNGKIDLTQVESVADLIHSSSSASARIAAKQLQGVFRDNITQIRSQLLDACALLELELDFANEDVEFVERDRITKQIDSTLALCHRYAESFASSTILRNGYSVSVLGYPNAGKSMLFNNLVGHNRSIVHDTEGTTRDYIRELVVWSGHSIVLNDTAGIRETGDSIEEIGVSLSNQVASDAECIVVVNDLSLGFGHSMPLLAQLQSKFPEKFFVLAQNKSDLIDEVAVRAAYANATQIETASVILSAVTSDGVDALKALLVSKAREATEPAKEALLNQRQLELLERCSDSLTRARTAIEQGDFSELVAYELRQGIDFLGEIVGENVSEEILNRIFSSFCIGK